MSIILLAILSVGAAVGLSILFNKLVIKDYPQDRRKGKYVATFIVFIIFINGITGTINARYQIDAILKNYTGEMEVYVNQNHSNMAFVRNGLDMTMVQNDVSRLNNAITELNTAFWPQAKELGVPKMVFDMASDFVSKEIGKKLMIVNTVNSFVDENNFLTVSSLLNGLRIEVMKMVTTTVIIMVIIFSVILLIYVFTAMSFVSKEKKKAA